jgi:hypothetical protein
VKGTVRCAIACLLLASCDGDQGLDGTWYSQIREGSRVSYAGERIIVEDGTHVVIRYCEGYVDELERSGNDLSYSDGTPYYLHVVNNRTLEGLGDLGSGTIHTVKLSSRTKFASGILQMTSTTVGDLRANEDVCAQVKNRIFAWTDRSERLAPVITVNAPFGAHRLTLELPFRKITPGVHPLVDFEEFVKGSGPGVMPWIQSDAFMSMIGNDVLPVVAGSVEVRSAWPDSLNIHGQLELSTGEQLVFDTRVSVVPPRAAGS